MKLRDLARAERLRVLLEQERHSTIAIGENSPGAALVQEPIEKSLNVDRAQEPIELPTEKFPGVASAQEPIEKSPDVVSPHPAIEFPDRESALA